MDTHLHHICHELYICRSVSHHYSTVNKHFIFFDFSFRPQGSIPLDFHTQDWWLVVTDESVTDFQVDNRRGWKSCVNEEEIKTWWGALIQKAQWAQVKAGTIQCKSCWNVCTFKANRPTRAAVTYASQKNQNYFQQPAGTVHSQIVQWILVATRERWRIMDKHYKKIF